MEQRSDDGCHDGRLSEDVGNLNGSTRTVFSLATTLEHPAPPCPDARSTSRLRRTGCRRRHAARSCGTMETLEPPQPACNLIPTRENAAHWLLNLRPPGSGRAPSTRFESSILGRDSTCFWAAFLHAFDVGRQRFGLSNGRGNCDRPDWTDAAPLMTSGQDVRHLLADRRSVRLFSR